MFINKYNMREKVIDPLMRYDNFFKAILKGKSMDNFFTRCKGKSRRREVDNKIVKYKNVAIAPPIRV